MALEEVVVTAPRYNSFLSTVGNLIFGKPATRPAPRRRPIRRKPKPQPPRRRRAPPSRVKPGPPPKVPPVSTARLPEVKVTARPFPKPPLPGPRGPFGGGGGALFASGMAFQFAGMQIADWIGAEINRDILQRRLGASAPKGPQAGRINPPDMSASRGPTTRRGAIPAVPEIFSASVTPRTSSLNPFPELRAPPLGNPGPLPAQPLPSLRFPQPQVAVGRSLLPFLSFSNLPELAVESARDKLSTLGFAQTTNPNPAGKLEPEKCRVVCEKRKNGAKKQRKKRKKKVCLTARDIGKAGLKSAFKRLGLTPR